MSALEINVLVSTYGEKKVPFGFEAGPLESSDLQLKLFYGPVGFMDFTENNRGSFLALAAQPGLRLPEGHIPSPGPVCIALDLQYEVDSVHA